MTVIARRSMLAAAGVAAGTVAAVMWLRKSAAPVLTLRPDATPAAVRLQGMAALQPVDPPQPVGAIGFVDATGATHSLREYAGKGAVLNLWANWCAPCVAEMPSLARLARAGAAQGLVVLPLSSDRGGAEVVRQFFSAHGITDLPVALDPSGAASEALGTRGLPTTLLIDRTGHARARLEGAADWGAPGALAAIRSLIG